MFHARCLVAPYVGAWIETLKPLTESYDTKSHPMWVRGLKHSKYVNMLHDKVAPYVGAWIETC